MKRRTKPNKPLLSSSNWFFQILNVHIKTTLLTFSSFQKMLKLTNVSVLLTSNTSLCLAVKMAGSTFGTLDQLLLRNFLGMSSALNGPPSNQSTFTEWMALVKLVYQEFSSRMTKILPLSTVPVMRVIYFRLIGLWSLLVMIIKLQKMSKSSATLSVITAQFSLWRDLPSTTILLWQSTTSISQYGRLQLRAKKLLSTDQQWLSVAIIPVVHSHLHVLVSFLLQELMVLMFGISLIKATSPQSPFLHHLQLLTSASR